MYSPLPVLILTTFDLREEREVVGPIADTRNESSGSSLARISTIARVGRVGRDGRIVS